MVGKSRQHELEAAVVTSCAQSQESNRCGHTAQLPPTYTVQDPSQEVTPPVVDRPFQLNLCNQDDPPQTCPDIPFPIILDSVTLTINSIKRRKQTNAQCLAFLNQNSSVIHFVLLLWLLSCILVRFDFLCNLCHSSGNRSTDRNPTVLWSLHLYTRFHELASLVNI